MDGWMDGRTNGYMNEQMVRWMDKWLHRWMDESISGWLVKWLDGWTDRWLDAWMHTRLDGTDRWMDGYMHPLPWLFCWIPKVNAHINMSHWINTITKLADRIRYLGQLPMLMDAPALTGRKNFLHQPLNSEVVHGVCIDVSAQLMKISTLCKSQNQVLPAISSLYIRYLNI